MKNLSLIRLFLFILGGLLFERADMGNILVAYFAGFLAANKTLIRASKIPDIIAVGLIIKLEWRKILLQLGTLK